MARPSSGADPQWYSDFRAFHLTFKGEYPGPPWPTSFFDLPWEDQTMFDTHCKNEFLVNMYGLILQWRSLMGQRCLNNMAEAFVDAYEGCRNGGNVATCEHLAELLPYGSLVYHKHRDPLDFNVTPPNSTQSSSGPGEMARTNSSFFPFPGSETTASKADLEIMMHDPPLAMTPTTSSFFSFPGPVATTARDDQRAETHAPSSRPMTPTSDIFTPPFLTKDIEKRSKKEGSGTVLLGDTDQ